MQKFDAIWGSGDVAENGIYTADFKHQVLSARELRLMDIDLVRVIGNDWSDEAIENLIGMNKARMAREELAWQRRIQDTQ